MFEIPTKGRDLESLFLSQLIYMIRSWKWFKSFSNDSRKGCGKGMKVIGLIDHILIPLCHFLFSLMCFKIFFFS